MASVQRDASTSANVISGLISRHSNVILGKAKGHKAKQDRTLPNLKKHYMTTDEQQHTDIQTFNSGKHL